MIKWVDAIQTLVLLVLIWLLHFDSRQKIDAIGERIKVLEVQCEGK